MAVPFAFPISHKDGTTVTKTKDFHQPVVGAPNNSISGLGLGGSALDLYACFEGVLLWDVATGSQAKRLLLRVDSTKVFTPLLQIQSIEAPPSLLVYENVDPNTVAVALTEILQAAYGTTSSSNKKLWHPSMRQTFFDRTSGEGPKELKQYITDKLNTVPQSDVPAIVQDLVSRFVNGQGGIVFGVAAGERLGTATSSGLIFRTVDNGSQFIDPIYYFHRLIYAGAAVNVLSDQPSKDLWSAAYPALQTRTPVPPARVLGTSPEQEELNLRSDLGITDDTVFKHALAEDHGTQQSLIEWSYSTTPGFDAEKLVAAGTVLTPNTDPSLPDTGVAASVWQQQGNAINPAALVFQIPCETVVGIISGESQGKTDAYVFLPLTDKQRAAIKSNPTVTDKDVVKRYDQVLGVDVLKYKLKRQLASAGFGSDVVTSLIDCQLSTPMRFTADQIRGTHKRGFEIGGVFQPVVISHSPVGKLVDVYRLDILEERLGGTITVSDTNLEYYHPASNKLDPKGKNPDLRTGYAAFADVPYQSDRSGLMRVMHIRLSEPAVFEVTVSLIVGADGSKVVDRTIPNGGRYAYALTDEIDIEENDPIAIRVVTPTPIKLEVEWFLGLPGEEGVDLTTPSITYLPGTGPLGSANNSFKKIPLPWSASEKVRDDRNLTWGDVATMLNASDGGFMVVGILQTKISTATGVFASINSFAANAAGELDITPPVNKADYIRHPDPVTDPPTPGWLIIPNNAIFVALALMRIHYRTLNTRFDLPLVSAAFFGGKLPEKQKTRWGVNLPRPDWADIIGRRYNDIVDRFNSTNINPPPTVRFKR